MVIKKQHIAAVYGGIAGLSMVIFTFILYRGGVDTYLGGSAYLGYAILIGLAATAALSLKKANGGYLEFRDALKAAFTVFVIALAAQTIFTWLLLNVFDNHFRAQLTTASLKKTEDFFRKMGMPDEKLDQAMAEERGKNQFSPGRMSMGLAFVYIVHFIIALLIAAVVRKKRPEAV